MKNPARSCHSEDATVIDPVSLSLICMYLGCRRFLRARSGLFLLCIHTTLHAVSYPSHPPLSPETKLVLTGTGIFAYTHRLDKKSEVCRVLHGRRSLKKINWPTPCFFLLKPGWSQGARAQRVGKDDDQSEDTQKIR